MTSVTIGNSVTSIGWHAFYATGLTSIVVNIANTVYSSQDGVLYNKDRTVLICYPYAKSGGFTIPDSVTSIGDEAFSNCSSLTSVTIPNSVTSIGSNAFSDCSSLPSVTIPNSLTSIGDGAFYHCIRFTSIAIPDSVTSIGSNAFGECWSLTNVTIGNSVTSIGYAVFENCGLTSVTIPDSVTSIGSCAFAYCNRLTSVTIPNSVTSIGSSAFKSCSRLISVTIGNKVKSIGSYAFERCTGLTSIVVDSSNAVYSSQDGVLYNKTKTIIIRYPGGKSGGFTIPNSVTSIGEAAFEHSYHLTSVTIPDSIISIGYRAFYACTSLTSVTVPNSVTNINDRVFYYCTGLTSVTIPVSVTFIGWGAFESCSSLTKAYFLGNAPSMASQVFYKCASSFSVCYTAGRTGFTNPWYGYPTAVCVPPTVINLSTFIATPKASKVILQWSTESEIDNAGFNPYRSESENGEYFEINDSLIPAQGSSTQGASYEFIDNDVQNRKTYYYKLEDICLNGTSTMHGPVSATPRLIFGMGK